MIKMIKIKKQLDLFEKLTKISALVNENDFVDFIKEADSVYIRDVKDDDGEDVFHHSHLIYYHV